MIDKIAAILDRRAMMVWPWENPKSEYFGKDYVPRRPSPKAIEKRRRAARKKAREILKLFEQKD
jgi:hypothetical protein